jgi:membrane protease subunit HflC
MNRSLLIVVGIVIIALGIVAVSAAFIVRQTEQAIVLRFGDPKQVIQEPGLHFKIPFVDDVTYFDARILDYAPPQEEIIAADQKRLVVDSFARYRIANPLEFYKSVGTEISARARLAGIMSASLRRVVGSETLASVLSEERQDIIDRIRTDVNEAAIKFGIDVVDVRIRRADLPVENANAIYQRMQTEREREAKEFRAQGEEISLRIRARADRERTVLIAESQRQSQVLRGEGDSEAIRIYADAFGQDPEFYAFYRSMEAYRNALKADGTTMILSPDSDFFSYFKNFNPAKPGPAAAAVAAPAAKALPAPSKPSIVLPTIPADVKDAVPAPATSQ